MVLGFKVFLVNSMDSQKLPAVMQINLGQSSKMTNRHINRNVDTSVTL